MIFLLLLLFKCYFIRAGQYAQMQYRLHPERRCLQSDSHLSVSLRLRKPQKKLWPLQLLA